MTDQLTVGSLFSGVGMIDLGLERAGCKVIWQAEIDPQASMVLARHWPGVPNLGDVEKIDWRNVERPDIVCGGFPCVSVSVAGRRLGTADERWLWPEYLRALRFLRPRYVLVENVPGLLGPIRVEDADGRHLGWESAPIQDVLAGLAELRYGWTYRCLDSQWFGVAQRRRRVFIVGCAGDRASSAQILLEPESRGRGAPPSRAPRENLAGTLGGGSGRRGWCDDLDRAGAFIEGSCYPNANRGPVGALDTFGGGPDDNSAQAGHLVRVDSVSAPRDARSLSTSNQRIDGDTETFIASVAVPLTAGGHPNSNEPGRHAEDDMNLVAFHMTQDPITEPELAPRLGTSSGCMGVAYPVALRGRDGEQVMELGEENVHNALRAGGKPGDGSTAHNWIVTAAPIPYRRATTTHGDDDPDRWEEAEASGTLASHSPTQRMAVADPVAMTVRRLTPTECERLMGIPDGHTAWGVDTSGKRVNMTDSARYRQCGNGCVVPVVVWVGRRLVAADAALEPAEEIGAVS